MEHEGHRSQRAGEHAEHATAASEAKPAAAGGDIPIALRPTRPQLIAIAVASVVALASGLIYSGYRINLSLGARDVGGARHPRTHGGCRSGRSLLGS